MNDRHYKVLFLCTGNSARSILGEALLNSMGGGRFKAWSAGSHPGGTVNPFALELLKRKGLATAELRSKGWDEFSAPGAPAFDFIFTVCDSAAREACPVWLGHPVTAHWGLPDPAAVEGSDEDKRKAFLGTFVALQRRIELLLALPAAKLESTAAKRELADIGKR